MIGNPNKLTSSSKNYHSFVHSKNNDTTSLQPAISALRGRQKIKDEKYAIITADIFTKTCSGPIISRGNKRMTDLHFYSSSDSEHYQLINLYKFKVA